MDGQRPWINYLRGIAGGAVGGAGYFLFWVIVRQGYYALAVPAAGAGLACGFASRILSNALGAICAAAGLVLAIVCEWQFRPFRDDASLSYFITHLPSLSGTTLTMLVLSGVFGFWFGRGRRHASTAEPSEVS